MKNIIRDRYSIAFIIAIISLVLGGYFFRQGKTSLAGACVGFSLLYLSYLFFQPAKMHLDKEIDAIADDALLIKKEDGCGFEAAPINKIIKDLDGAKRANGLPYKFVNGADIKAGGDPYFKPMSFGSNIMQWLGKGGENPASIQNDPCWN